MGQPRNLERILTDPWYTMALGIIAAYPEGVAPKRVLEIMGGTVRTVYGRLEACHTLGLLNREATGSGRHTRITYTLNAERLRDVVVDEIEKVLQSIASGQDEDMADVAEEALAHIGEFKRWLTGERVATYLSAYALRIIKFRATARATIPLLVAYNAYQEIRLNVYIPTIRKIQQGEATEADLQAADALIAPAHTYIAAVWFLDDVYTRPRLVRR